MYQNEYRSSEQLVKIRGIHAVASHVALLAHVEALSKQLVASQLAQVNVNCTIEV